MSAPQQAAIRDQSVKAQAILWTLTIATRQTESSRAPRITPVNRCLLFTMSNRISDHQPHIIPSACIILCFQSNFSYISILRQQLAGLLY